MWKLFVRTNLELKLTTIIAFTKALSVDTLAFLRGGTEGPIQVKNTNFALIDMSSPVVIL